MIQTYMNGEIFEKLEMSKTEVTELTLRDLRCPNCRFLIDKIYSDIRGHMQVKCPKCKNAYIMNVAYFRKKKNGERSFKVYLTKIE